MKAQDLLSVKRLPAAAFGLLVVATIGAFFLTQHLKSAPPVVWFNPYPTPVPGAFHPVNGRTDCKSSTGKPLDYSRTEITLAVYRADSVGVYVVNADDPTGHAVATIASGRPMQASVLGTSDWHPAKFTWNGRLADGTIAPEGRYLFRVVLEHQDRNITLDKAPVQVVTTPPRARVTSVQLLGQPAPQAGTPVVFSPPAGTLRINYTPGHYRRLWINIYRTDIPGKPERVAHYAANATGVWARWNGLINDKPAPAGTYLAGITSQNLACDQASWPVVIPPSPGTTPGAGVTVRYLSVTPPLTPTISGAMAGVAVDSQSAYSWSLHRAGFSRVLASGSGPAGSTTLRVQMPNRLAGLYVLVVRAGTHSAAVPLVAYRAGRKASQARVLVVLPMLTWMGGTPVDDTGDGLADTLGKGQPVSLDRPLVDGPPDSLDDDAALLNYLDSLHRSYQVTTDVALAEGKGPSLVDRWGVLLPDGSDYLPAALSTSLTGFVNNGGRLLTLGVDSLHGTSAISGFPAATRAAAPADTKTDIFGAQRGPLTSTGGALITELSDDLNLFGGPVAFSGFSHYQPIEPPASAAGHVSAAGIASGSPAIVAFKLGSGIVTEVGLPNFGSSLAHDVDSQQLMGNVWALLAKQR